MLLSIVNVPIAIWEPKIIPDSVCSFFLFKKFITIIVTIKQIILITTLPKNPKGLRKEFDSIPPLCKPIYVVIKSPA
jgi:hypothetical protein